MFDAEEWGDTSGKGDKARHGMYEMFRPRFHAHYENRSFDCEDTLPKLADIWLEGLPMMNNRGDVIGKISYPMKGFEQGWMQAKGFGHEDNIKLFESNLKMLEAPPAASSESSDDGSDDSSPIHKDLINAMSSGKLPPDMAAEFFVQYESKKMKAKL
jgi:hypothetical protein